MSHAESTTCLRCVKWMSQGCPVCAGCGIVLYPNYHSRQVGTLTIKQRSPPNIRLSIGTTTFKEEQCLTRWLGLGPLRIFYTVEKLYFVHCGLLWIFAVLENYASFSNTFGILVEAAGGDVTAQRSTQENPLQLNSPLRLEHWTVCSNRTVSSRRPRDAVLTANPATFSYK
uniref:(northern house mosquito) hypothetical protein n=1 Tax=Culex pipiens TaxID=7175 RepID=A0A8D8F705_CULPI